jgi:hypothetical protein
LPIGPAGVACRAVRHRLALKPAMPGLPIARIHHLPIGKFPQSERYCFNS